MTKKEVSELRRRFQPEKTAISHIYGCYVNTHKEIISYIDESLGLMPEDEAGQYLTLLKKSLSGRLGKNLIDIVFSTQQVMDSDEHRTLMALRDSELKDGALRDAFYQKIIQSLDMADSNYLILLAYDAYDVPYHGNDGMRQADSSDLLYRYIICAICPVKDGKLALGYFSGDNEFHNCLANQIVTAPELGFIFPAFDDRTANIYNALFYARKPEELHHEFIDGIFKVEPPMSAAEQREAFQAALTNAELTNMSIIQSVHERLKARIDEHADSKDNEPLTVSSGDIAAILTDIGVDGKKIKAFEKNYAERFGSGAVLPPENIIDSSRFELKIGDATVSVDPEYSYLIETQIIEGKKYILIPAEAEAEINGFAVKV